MFSIRTKKTNVFEDFSFGDKSIGIVWQHDYLSHFLWSIVLLKIISLLAWGGWMDGGPTDKKSWDLKKILHKWRFLTSKDSLQVKISPSKDSSQVKISHK